MSTAQRTATRYLVFSAKTSTGFSSAYLGEDFRNGIVEITVTGATPTVKLNFLGSNLSPVNGGVASSQVPDFSSADSASNPWSLIDTNDLSNGSSTNGTVTLSSAGTRKYEFNTNGMRWFGLQLETMTTATVTATLSFFDNR